MRDFGFQIDKKARIPLHHQIFLQIKESIEEGRWKEGDKIPSETDLQKIFDVSRITVRKAIEDLERDGYVQKRQGIGTVVMPVKHDYSLEELTSFSSDIEKIGGTSKSVVRAFQEMEADIKIASALGVEIGETVYYLERLRISDDRIVGLHKTYIIKNERIQIDPNEIHSETSLYRLLTEKGVQLDHADEVIEARIADNELKEILKVNGEQAIFYKERVTYDLLDKPIEYVEIFYLADHYRYKASMKIKK
ncbi:GntR family transcriptional regulator [Seinonella peptonophila]|uniref:GntR family transcriptional regulator n=1 Tax=Seinonella peptonophila TaxID=112248 RepID=A0A1M4XLG3_9BACL|nr:GntR family transcriptional regulator [Seinonella peptonophila]SHE94355.1 GntR family transcriptional regulator [Seinonella peptonophila]